MPAPEPMTRHHIHLREGDYEFLINAYRSKGLRANTVIRQLIAKHVEQLKAQLAPAPDLEEPSP